MAISFACAECGKKLKAPDNLVGKRIKCPACQTPATVPFPETSEDEEVLGSDWLNSDAAEDPEAAAERRAEKARKARAAKLAEGESDDTSEEDEEVNEEPESTLARLSSRPRKKKAKSQSETEVEAKPARVKEQDAETFNYHWVFLLGLIPLTVLTFWPQESVEKRLERVFAERPELVNRLDDMSVEDLLAQLPGNKFPGALFARDTYFHWAIGAVAAVSFLTLLFLMFPGSGKRTRRLFLTGLFTGTVGILLLLVFQFLASATAGLRIRGGRGLGVLIFLVLWLIGYSYRCANDPNIGFWGSFFGFTVGVGLCEELCKAMPIWFYLTSARKTGWRGACLVGLASGIGFGISEGIMYSGDMYNGIQGAPIYLVRFISCVSLHAMWSGTVALLMYKNQDFLDTEDLGGMLGGIAYYLGGAMVLHGLYDTLLKHDLPIVALLIGFGTYFWMFRLVAESRGT